MGLLEYMHSNPARKKKNFRVRGNVKHMGDVGFLFRGVEIKVVVLSLVWVTVMKTC